MNSESKKTPTEEGERLRKLLNKNFPHAEILLTLTYQDRERRGDTMSDILYPHGVDSARVIQVIETKSARGAGTTEQPARIVTEYWSLDGKKLAEHDPAVFVPETADGPCEPGQSMECGYSIS